LESVKQKYERRKDGYDRLLRKQEKAEKEISNLRLLSAAAEIGIAVYLYIKGKYIFLPPACSFS